MKHYGPEDLLQLTDRAVLAERFYVPRKWVKKAMLDAFTTILDAEDYELDEFGDPVEVVRELHGYHKYTQVVAFHRGDVRKHDKVFNSIYRKHKVVDIRSTKEMKRRYRFVGKLRKDQKRIVRKWLKYGFGIIKAPPRYGKTVVLLYLAIKMGLKTLVLAHQQDLLDQFYKTAHNLSNMFDHQDSIGYLISRHWSDIKKFDISLSTWQLFNKSGKASMRRYRDAFGLVIVDEVHRAPSECYRKVVWKFNPKYRLGCTATSERKDQIEPVAFDIVGPVVVKGRMKHVPLHIFIHQTGFEPKLGKWFRWHQLEKALAFCKSRNNTVLKFVENDLRDPHAFILLATRPVKHIRLLVDRLRAMDIEAVAFYGKSFDREKLLDDIRKGKYRVVVANRQMLTGINVPRWTHYYNLMPSANKPQYYQEFSRIRTPFRERGWEKSFAVIRDFVDHFGACYGCLNIRNQVYETEYAKYIKQSGDDGQFWIRRSNEKRQQEKQTFRKRFRDG